MNLDKIYIGIGCQPEQELAFHVLKKSIEENFLSTNHELEIFPLHSLNINFGQEILNKQGTPFSFQRFIFADWFLNNSNLNDTGVYLDSDMLVFSNIDHLVNIFKRLNQDIAICDAKEDWQRKKQQAVMLFNVLGAEEIKKKFNSFLENKISYQDLMEKPEGKFYLPYTWNSQEEMMKDTNLIHYTDMDFQPWLRKDNFNAGVWLSYLRSILKDELIKKILIKEISKRHVRPSLAELLDNPPNYPITSFSAGLRDVFFVPPHRFKILQGRIRLLFSPLLNFIILINKIFKNNKINKI